MTIDIFVLYLIQQEVKIMSSQEFTPAYTITNERWRWARDITRDAKHVLTVAGSGDQALTYILSGATHVDTYDITRCARIIQDIKTTAIQILPHSEYTKLIQELHYAINPFELVSMAPIMPHLPHESIAEIRKNKDKIYFYNGAAITMYPQNQFTETEYAHLKSKITKPFKFYLGSIDSLNTQLTKQYDLIDTSNIFDYGKVNIAKTLASLLPHMRIGGRLIYLPQNKNRNYDKYIELKSGERLEYETTKILPHTAQMIIFQRTR